MDNINNEWVDGFLTWIRAVRKEDTYKGYKNALRQFLRWLELQELKIIDLKPNNLADYLLYLENRGLKISTRSIYMTSIRSFWQWLAKQDKAPFDYTLVPYISPGTRKRREIITDTERDAILESFNDVFIEDSRNRAIFAFLCATGCRVGEMCKIQVSNVDLNARRTLIQTLKREGHERVLYWDMKTNLYLRDWINKRNALLKKKNVTSEALFCSLATNHLGSALKRCSVARIFRKIKEDQNINKELTPHVCRHSFVTKLVRRGVALPLASEMAGHAKVETTMRYVHIHKDYLEKAYREAFEA